MIRNLTIAACAVSALALFAVQKAESAQVMMCGPEASGQGTGARTIGGTGSTITSGTLYTLNAAGCALVASGDVASFRALGFVNGPNCCFSAVTVTGVLSATTAVTLAPLPAGAYIREWIVQNTTTNAVTGGFAIGTTTNGVDVVATTACASTCLTRITDANLAKSVVSSTAATALSISAITAGNSANLTVTMIYGYF